MSTGRDKKHSLFWCSVRTTVRGWMILPLIFKKHFEILINQTQHHFKIQTCNMCSRHPYAQPDFPKKVNTHTYTFLSDRVFLFTEDKKMEKNLNILTLVSKFLGSLKWYFLWLCRFSSRRCLIMRSEKGKFT